MDETSFAEYARQNLEFARSAIRNAITPGKADPAVRIERVWDSLEGMLRRGSKVDRVAIAAGEPPLFTAEAALGVLAVSFRIACTTPEDSDGEPPIVRDPQPLDEDPFMALAQLAEQCGQCIRAQNEGRREAAWNIACDAYETGIQIAQSASLRIDTEAIAKEAIRRMQKARAEVRHADTRSLRDDVLAWYEAHKHEYPDTKSAAKAVMTAKLVPIKQLRTIKNWLDGQ